MPNPNLKPKKGKRLRDQGFRPSNFPRLEQCIHFVERDAAASDEANRGQQLHRWLEQVLNDELDPGEIPDAEARETVLWGLNEIARRGIVVHGVEEGVEIAGPDGAILTAGVVDAWGRTGTELWGIDFKTGDQRDYSAQFAAYGRALMSKAGEGRCVWLEIYLDLRVANEYNIPSVEAEDRVVQLHRRFLAKRREEPVANIYCDWCGARAHCPVWLNDASRAMAASPSEPVAPQEQPVDRLVYEIERLKQDPVKLGQFYTAYRRLEKLVEDEWRLKEAIFDYLERGEAVPGFRLQRSPVQETVEVEQVLLKCAVPMGTIRAREFLSVSIPRLRQEWARWSREPLPVEIKQSPVTFHVRSETPKGSGRAAAARAERTRRHTAGSQNHLQNTQKNAEKGKHPQITQIDTD
ncbi:MAG: hypothetical protein JO015_13315 [Verrucomicrobia bacterium]|nr:hypothetical protein [Verrucomicrobiota bacterium]